jgi:hypothetical protein
MIRLAKKERKFNYKYEVGDIVVYTGGMYDKYKNQECEIVIRERQHQGQYYKIKFADGLIVTTTLSGIRRKESE